MDNLFETEVVFNTVKYEKENAMQRFTKFQRMKKIIQVLEVVFVFLMLIWSTKKIPIFVRFSCKVFEIWVYFLNPHFVFLIGNSIIFALFLLCKHNDARNSTENDMFKESSGHTEASNETLTSPMTFEVELTSPLTCEVALTSPLTLSEVATQAVEENGKVEEEELKMVVAENVELEAVEVAIEAAEREIRRFQRTLSEKLKREIGARQREKLRQSETENGRPEISRGGGGERRMVKSTFKTVEHLTNEEFKLAIDAFIDKHKVLFKEQIGYS